MARQMQTEIVGVTGDDNLPAPRRDGEGANRMQVPAIPGQDGRHHGLVGVAYWKRLA
jgi:hypothetical protein